MPDSRSSSQHNAEQLVELEEQLRQLHTERESVMATRGAIDVEKARLESDLEHLERACQDEFHASLHQIRTEVGEEEWARDYQEVVRGF